MKNPVLKTSNGIKEALSNLWYKNECSIAKIEDAVEDSKNGEELSSKLNELKLFRKFTLDRETDTKVRLKAVDKLGNVSYFEATKTREENYMTIAKLLEKIDGSQEIKIVHTNTQKILYNGQKWYVMNINYDLEVAVIYTTKNEMVIEVL